MGELSHSINCALEDAKKIAKNGGPKWHPPSPEKILQLREATGLTQTKFAEEYGFNLVTYRKWEKGRATPEQVSCMVLQMIKTDAKGTKALINKTRKQNNIDA